MSKSEEEKKNIPEWNVFDRLDELETITLKLMEKTDTAEPTVKEKQKILEDIGIMARMALVLAFVTGVRHLETKYIRKTRDEILQMLKEEGLSTTSLEWANEMMTEICERKEKRK
jgi:hypothetical protein